jgi:ABC-type uncharacterized transport system ATPase subunit
MVLRGQPYVPAKPAEARRLGVAMVFQHFSLFEALNVAENVALGMETRRRCASLPPASARFRGIWPAARPGRMVGDLSAGERQRVEIIRCLLQDPKLLIMDEPTSVLTPQEVEILFRTLRQLRARGRRSSISATSSKRSARSATRRRSCGAARWWRPAPRASGRRARWPN